MSLRKRKRRLGAPVLGVSICVIRNGCVLLTRRAKPPFENTWSLPGGRVERGERLEEAALRELREETGIGAELRGVFDWTEIIGAGQHFVVAVFLAGWKTGEAKAAGDAKAARWVSLEETSELALTPGLEEILRKALRH
jgi:8-oxo-dGTP diphosphatase